MRCSGCLGFDAQRLLNAARPGDGLLQIRMGDGDMAHFPERFGRFFSVQMYVDAGQGEALLQPGVVHRAFESGGPEQVDHDGRAVQARIA